MEIEKDKKRKKDRRDDDGYRKEKKSKRARTRSRSPDEPRERDSGRKRRHSSSKSPDRSLKKERQRDKPSNETEVKSEAPVRKNKETDMLNTRTGGAYIPPARLRMMQAQITDKSSVAFQRLAWEALKKSIHGFINKVNVGNIGIIIKHLLKENIVRGRGLLCRSVIQAQAASPTFTNVYAALVAAVNSRFPNIGELLLKRLVIQFKRGFKRNDKAICISSASFIAHLVNQRVAHEILALELLTLLVETPTDDSVEVAIAFLKECGQKLTEVSSKGVNAIFEMLRNILHEGQLDKRVQYMIEVMFQVWKDGFKDHPALLEELELVPEEEQFTHLLMLDDATDPQDILNVFKFDEKYEENEQKYTTLSKEILGSDAETDEEGSDESGSEESDDEEGGEAQGEQKGMTIIDNTETNLVALRRTIYLTINSSLDFEECAHKLMKMQLKPGQEVELCHMFLDCCAEQRTYEKFYGLLAQRFCNINRMYIGPFEQIFKDSYSTAHRLDTNRLRNVSKFFAHLLFTDSIGWEVLECVKLNEEDTTSSSRIYIKILFQELAEYMGLKKLNDRLKDPTLQDAFSGVFPRDNPKNTRFSINFFTSIGLGGLTDELREHLKQMPKNLPPQNVEINVDSSSDSSSSSSSSDDSSSSSSDSSSSDSDEESGKEKGDKKSKKKNKSKDKTPKTPEETAPEKQTERWGHDGFYDTYGKDARRVEARPDRNERDKDNFAIPRDVRRNGNHSKRDDYRSQDNFRDDRRRDEYRPEGRRDTRDRNDDRRRDTEDRIGESDYRRDDDRHRDRTDADRSRDRIEDERRRERKYDERREKNDYKRSNDDDYRQKERNVDERPGYNDDHRGGKNDEKRDISDRDRREMHDDTRRTRHDDRPTRETSRSGDYPHESRSRREKDYRGKDVDDSRREEENYKKTNKDRDRSRTNREEPIEDNFSRGKMQEKMDKSTKEHSKNRQSDKGISTSEQDEEKSDKRRKKDKSESSEEEENRSKKNKKKKDSKQDKDSEDEESSNKKKKVKKSKNKEVSSDDTDSDSEDEHSNKKKKKKSKSKKRKDDSSADEEQQEKENKHKKDKSRRGDDEKRSRRRDKDKKQSVEDEAEWDIRRESSLRREMPERYWKN